MLIRIARAAPLLILTGWATIAFAHHPGGGSKPLVVVDGRRDGYRAILEVYPPDPMAGNPTQFMLWVMPERWDTAYRGPARLWI